jgi:hypothetical protein
MPRGTSVSYTARGPRKLSDEQIITEYLECRDSDRTAIAAGCSAATVLRILHENNIPVGLGRGKGGRRRTVLRLSDDEIVARYQAGQSVGKILEVSGGSPDILYRLLRRHGVRLRAPNDYPRKKRREPVL